MALLDNAVFVNGATGVTVVELGTAAQASGATLTLSVTVPAGALILVAVNEFGQTTSGTLADAAGNTYNTAIAQTLSNNVGRLTVFYAYNAMALTAQLITYTKVGAVQASLSVFYATGIKTSGDPRDVAFQVATAVQTAAPTVTSNAPTAANNLIVGILAYADLATTARAYTQDAGHNFNLPPTGTTTQAKAMIGGGHLKLGGSLAVTYSPTIAAACDTAAVVLAFAPANTTLGGWWNIPKWSNHTAVAGEIVRQNATPAIGSERAFVCIVAGATGATEPVWVLTRGALTVTGSATYQECTGITGVNGDLVDTLTWSALKTAVASAAIIGQICKRANGASYWLCKVGGTMGATEPAWTNDTAGTVQVDNTVTWTCLGVIGNFPNWGAPAARLAIALAANWISISGTVYVAHDHAESQTTIMTTTPAVGGVKIVCVNRAGSMPPVSADLRTTATLMTIGTVTPVIAGASNSSTYFYGLSFICGPSLAAVAMTINNGFANARWRDCQFIMVSNNAGNNINIGGGRSRNIWDNCAVNFADVGQTIVPIGGEFIWRKTANPVLGSVFPTILITGSINGSGIVTLDGLDLSVLGAGKTIAGATGATLLDMSITNCKLGAGVTLAATGAASGANTQRVTYVNCDSAQTNYQHGRSQGNAVQSTELAIVRTGGATDGQTPVSWKFVSASGNSNILPYESIPIDFWNDSLAARTLTLYGIWGGGAVPLNDDIWVEVEYLGTAGGPKGTVVSSGKADILAPGIPVDADTSVWGAGSTTPFKMVTPSFTPVMKGPIRAIVKVARPSATFYVDPRPV